MERNKIQHIVAKNAVLILQPAFHFFPAKTFNLSRLKTRILLNGEQLLPQRLPVFNFHIRVSCRIEATFSRLLSRNNDAVLLFIQFLSFPINNSHIIIGNSMLKKSRFCTPSNLVLPLKFNI